MPVDVYDVECFDAGTQFRIVQDALVFTGDADMTEFLEMVCLCTVGRHPPVIPRDASACLHTSIQFVEV